MLIKIMPKSKAGAYLRHAELSLSSLFLTENTQNSLDIEQNEHLTE